MKEIIYKKIFIFLILIPSGIRSADLLSVKPECRPLCYATPQLKEIIYVGGDNIWSFFFSLSLSLSDKEISPFQKLCYLLDCREKVNNNDAMLLKSTLKESNSLKYTSKVTWPAFVPYSVEVSSRMFLFKFCFFHHTGVFFFVFFFYDVIVWCRLLSARC